MSTCNITIFSKKMLNIKLKGTLAITLMAVICFLYHTQSRAGLEDDKLAFILIGQIQKSIKPEDTNSPHTLDTAFHFYYHLISLIVNMIDERLKIQGLPEPIARLSLENLMEQIRNYNRRVLSGGSYSDMLQTLSEQTVPNRLFLLQWQIAGQPGELRYPIEAAFFMVNYLNSLNDNGEEEEKNKNEVQFYADILSLLWSTSSPASVLPSAWLTTAREISLNLQSHYNQVFPSPPPASDSNIPGPPTLFWPWAAYLSYQSKNK